MSKKFSKYEYCYWYLNNLNHMYWQILEDVKGQSVGIEGVNFKIISLSICVISSYQIQYASNS